jgi:hypothetical protein
MKTVFPAVADSQVSGVNSIAWTHAKVPTSKSSLDIAMELY